MVRVHIQQAWSGGVRRQEGAGRSALPIGFPCRVLCTAQRACDIRLHVSRCDVELQRRRHTAVRPRRRRRHEKAALLPAPRGQAALRKRVVHTGAHPPRVIQLNGEEPEMTGGAESEQQKRRDRCGASGAWFPGSKDTLAGGKAHLSPSPPLRMSPGHAPSDAGGRREVVEHLGVGEDSTRDGLVHHQRHAGNTQRAGDQVGSHQRPWPCSATHQAWTRRRPGWSQPVPWGLPSTCRVAEPQCTRKATADQALLWRRAARRLRRPRRETRGCAEGRQVAGDVASLVPPRAGCATSSA